VSNKISVVMPAYNEAVHILDNLRETIDTMESLGRPYEVIVVDDGSPDHTYYSASRALAEYADNVKIVRYRRNAGKGNALMCGFHYCTGDIVVFLDADMDLHPAQIPRLIAPIDCGDADVVVGSKWHPRSDINYPFIRKAWSNGYSLLVRLLFGLPLRDTQTGLKAFRSEVLERVFLRVLAKRFAFDVEVLVNAHHLGYRIVDVPVSLRFKRGTFGRVGLGDVWDVFVDTLAIFYRMQIARYYDAVGEAAARNAMKPGDVELYVGERESEVLSVSQLPVRERVATGE
jgi:glycosyltransferase involved in cell wall biosynthesis